MSQDELSNLPQNSPSKQPNQDAVPDSDGAEVRRQK